jgi:hypothetical protein
MKNSQKMWPGASFGFWVLGFAISAHKRPRRFKPVGGRPRWWGRRPRHPYSLSSFPSSGLGTPLYILVPKLHLGTPLPRPTSDRAPPVGADPCVHPLAISSWLRAQLTLTPGLRLGRAGSWPWKWGSKTALNLLCQLLQ